MCKLLRAHRRKGGKERHPIALGKILAGFHEVIDRYEDVSINTKSIPAPERICEIIYRL